LKQSVILDENIFEAIAKANELVVKAKQDLKKLDELIFNGGVMRFNINKNKLRKSVLVSASDSIYNTGFFNLISNNPSKLF